MTDELKKKLTDAGILEEVEAVVTEENSLAVELAMEEYAESADYKAVLAAAEKTGYAKGYSAGKAKASPKETEKEEAEKPACFGSYKKNYPKQAKTCRACAFAGECKKK
jgi:hypothetical protein